MHLRTYIHTLQGETLEYNLMWYFAVQRACGALSKLVHVFNGNTANRSSSTKRPLRSSPRSQEVWIRLGERSSACGCRAFLTEGRCGHHSAPQALLPPTAAGSGPTC